MLWAAKAELVATGARGFRLTLKTPFPLMLDVLGKPNAPLPVMLPERLAAVPVETRIREIVGSGPFRFRASEWRPGASMVLERFADYVPRAEPADYMSGGKRPLMERIEWLYIPDQNTALAALNAGEIDYYEAPPLDFIASMERIYRRNTDTVECASLPLQLDARVFNWLNLNAQPIANNPNVGSPPVGLALNRLRGLFMDGTAEKVIFVKCEDLTTAPAAAMSRIYSYLKLPEFVHDFDNIQKQVAEDTKMFGVFGDHNVGDKLTAMKGWNDVLPDKLSDAIRRDFDWYFTALGY
jgi:hypothetical protein